MLTLLGYTLKEGKIKTIVAKRTEEDAVRWVIENNVEVINGLPTVRNGKPEMKRLSGDLKRFDQGDFKPLVVLSELVTSDGRVVGYRTANNIGEVYSIKLIDMIRFCKGAVRAGRIPLQNGMFIDFNDQKREHIKGYPECPFEKEVLRVRKKVQPEIEKVKAVATKKTPFERLSEVFTAEQLEQLKLGKEHGVNIKVYGHPAFSAIQMRVLRETLEAGLNAKLFAHPDFSVNHMKTFKADLKYGEDIRPYLNPKLSPGQISEIQAGIASGVDISTYADPDIPDTEMAEIRLRLEKNIWTSVQANKVKEMILLEKNS